MSPKAAPYGTWLSPITSDAIIQNVSECDLELFSLISQSPFFTQAIKVTSIFIDPITSSIYHTEARPSEAGRCVIVDTSKGKDIFGPGWNARSRVQEYGGGAAIAYGGVVYFSNFGDLKVYAVDTGKGGEPVAVTPGDSWTSFAQASCVDDETDVTGKLLDLQITKSTGSRISRSLPLILISSSLFWKTTLAHPHPRSRPLSS